MYLPHRKNGYISWIIKHYVLSCLSFLTAHIISMALGWSVWFEIKGIVCQSFACLKHSSLLFTLNFPVRWWVEVGNAQNLLQESWFRMYIHSQEICNLFAFWQIALQAVSSWQKWSTVFSLNAVWKKQFFISLCFQQWWKPYGKSVMTDHCGDYTRGKEVFWICVW